MKYLTCRTALFHGWGGGGHWCIYYCMYFLLLKGIGYFCQPLYTKVMTEHYFYVRGFVGQTLCIIIYICVSQYNAYLSVLKDSIDFILQIVGLSDFEAEQILKSIPTCFQLYTFSSAHQYIMHTHLSSILFPKHVI